MEIARKGNGENSRGGVKTLPMKRAGPEVDGPGGWCGSFECMGGTYEQELRKPGGRHELRYTDRCYRYMSVKSHVSLLSIGKGHIAFGGEEPVSQVPEELWLLSKSQTSFCSLN